MPATQAAVQQQVCFFQPSLFLKWTETNASPEVPLCVALVFLPLTVCKLRHRPNPFPKRLSGFCSFLGGLSCYAVTSWLNNLIRRVYLSRRFSFPNGDKNNPVSVAYHQMGSRGVRRPNAGGSTNSSLVSLARRYPHLSHRDSATSWSIAR